MLKYKLDIEPKKTIYGFEVERCGFGDAWAVTSYLLRMSEEAKKPVKFASSEGSLKNRIELISNFLDSTGKIQMVHQFQERVIRYCEAYSVKFVRTKKRWKDNHSRIVAYQFDGNHLASQKNPPPDKVAALVKELTYMGYQPIDIGHMKPLDFVINTLAKCKFFVGCPSGMAHVSMSVGNPIYVITRNMSPKFVDFMKVCQYKTASNINILPNMREFISNIRNYSSICLN